jgi:HlyD family secretion protein
VRLRVPEPPAYLKPDMTVSVEVVIGRNESALALPLEAVRDVETPEPWVLLARDGEAVKLPVKVGLRGVGRIEITEGWRRARSPSCPPAARSTATRSG